MSADDWDSPQANSLAVGLDGRHIVDADGETSRDGYLLLLNAHWEAVDFTLPSGKQHWFAVLTSGEPTSTPGVNADNVITLECRSLLLLHSPA